MSATGVNTLQDQPTNRAQAAPVPLDSEKTGAIPDLSTTAKAAVDSQTRGPRTKSPGASLLTKYMNQDSVAKSRYPVHRGLQLLSNVLGNTLGNPSSPSED